MSAIRPDLPPSNVLAPSAPAGVRSAQAAFFRAALTQVQGASETIQTTGAASFSKVSAASTSPDPDRPARPGALLDIRV